MLDTVSLRCVVAMNRTIAKLFTHSKQYCKRIVTVYNNGMKKKIIDLYGNGSVAKVAECLGMSRQRVASWDDELTGLQKDSVIAALVRKDLHIPRWLLK